MRLLLVELNRFRSRRAIALMMLAAVLLIGWMTIDTIWSSRVVSASEIAAAKDQAAQEMESAQDDYQQCLDDPESYFGTDDMGADDCELYEPDYRWYLTRQPLMLEEELGDTGEGAIIVLAGLAIIIGTTFAGADWATGSMSNQLLFRPRRLQVWSAKAGALVLGVTVVAAVVLALQWGAYLTTAEIRDIGHSPDFMSDLWQKLARALALVAAGGLGGYALTMLLRSTVGTLALLFFYSVGGEALVSILPFEKVSQWSLGSNVFAWLDNGVEVYDDTLPCPDPSVECYQSYVLSLEHAAGYLGVMLLVAVVVSLVLFRQRDVP